MGLFDDYFDPQQFEGGGLLGRMLSLQQQQGQYQPSQGFDAPGAQPVGAASPSQFPFAESSTPIGPVQSAAGPTANVPVRNSMISQSGGTGGPQPAPDFGDRLNAGFQSWAHTPLGNPFAGIANGVAGFSSGQPVGQPSTQNSQSRSDASQQSPGSQGVPQAPPDFGDRLSAGFQSWAHTPLGNPFAGLANGIAGFGSGQPVSQPPPQTSPPRDDTSQQGPVLQAPGPQAPILSNRRMLAGRFLQRSNDAGFDRGFPYGR